MLLVGLLPQEADRRCDFVGVDGVNVAGVESLVGGDVSTSRQDTDGDLMCCHRDKNNIRKMRTRFPDTKGSLEVWPVMKNNEMKICEMKINNVKRSVTHNYLGEFRQQMIDGGREVEEVVAVTDQTVLGGSEAVRTVKHSS